MNAKSFIALVFLAAAVFSVASAYNQKSIWEIFDEEFKPLYDKEIARILHENQWKQTVGEYDKNAKVDLDGAQRAERNVEQARAPLPYPPGLELMGRGLDWVTGENRAQVIQFNQRFRRRYWSPYTNTTYSVADEVFILNTPEVRVNEQVDVFSTSVQFQESKSREFGISVSLHNDGVFKMSQETQRMRGMLMQYSSRVATTERLYTFYIMNMLPPENLQLTDEVQQWLSVLPAYDSNSKAVYVRFFERFGTHVASSAIFGGSIKLEDVVITRLLVDPSNDNIKKQTSTFFKYRTEPNQERRSEIQATIDPIYSENHTPTVSFNGGVSEGLDPTNWQQWIPTVKESPAMLRTRMLPLSEFVSDPRLKSDLEQATQDYARDLLKTPADTGSTDLQPQVNFAHYNQGSRVIWTSSVNRRCWYKSSWIFWKKKVCEDRRNHQNMVMPGINPSDEFYMFGDNDGNQRATIDLGTPRYIMRLVADVARTGEDRQVWDFIRFYTSETNGNWEHFGTIGTEDNLPDIVQRTNEVAIKFPRRIRYIHVQFGPWSKQGSAGSRVYSIQGFGVDESANRILGNLEAALETRVSGWIFNSLDQSRDAVVRVYANGQQIAEGRPANPRTDIQGAFQLPSSDRIGYDIPITLPGEGRFDVHVVLVGFNGHTRESVHYMVWGLPPPGKLMDVTPASVGGWAWNRFSPANPVQIEIWVNNALQASGQTGVDFPISRTALNVDGNHGFRIPVNIRGSGMFNFVAYAILEGQKRLLYNPVQLDMRYPRGVIEELTADRVVGWAIDPAFPDNAVEIAIFIDNIRVTNKRRPANTTLLRQDVNDAWNVQGNHGFNIPLRIQGGKVHEVAVYTVQSNNELAFIAKKLVALNLEEFSTSPNSQNPLVNLLGAGYDAVYEEFRLPVIQFNYDDERFMDNPYAGNFVEWAVPNEVMINANAEVIIEEHVEVYNNTRAYLERRAKTTGFSFGFFFGLFGKSETTITVTSTLRNDAMRFVTYDRWYKMFDAILLPPCCGPNTLQMHQYAAFQVSQLPPYNRNTKHQYLRFIQYFGTHYLHKATFGGQISMQQTVNTSKMMESDETYIKKQSGFTFGFIVTLSFSSASSEYKRRLTNEFVEASNHNIRYIGGHPELFQLQESDDWSKSVKDNPTLITFELKELSEMIEDERKRADLHQAIVDYIEGNADTDLSCPVQTNYATLKAGARVTGYSSVHTQKTQDTLDNLLRQDKTPWMIDGETGFLFADGDDLQQLVVDLGQLRYIKSIGAHVTPAGRDRAVWDYIRVQVSLDNRIWTDWQLVGVPDGVAEITNFIYEMPLIRPAAVRYIQFTFGPSAQNTNLGSRITDVTAIGCSE
eukprot:TRINITY_DN1758_c0_g1_i1.p1 TRINITY_DN1758_c0_g1~~TRINITY_DN1758_c0_g1_i1.p1  ORF type:complete len:1349 (+),score=412.75 TRINITY_DN1758_c0_g1_i1:87-4133(+)